MYTQPHDIGLWTSYNFRNGLGFPYPELLDELPPLPASFEPTHDEPAIYRRRRAGSGPVDEELAEAYWRYYIWGYYRHVEMVDAEIGRLLDVLDATDRVKDTLVIFTSDHGEGMAEHGFTTKHFLYDSATRVPLIVSWPGVIPEGRELSADLVSGLDLFPTVCDYWDLPVAEGVKGVSLRGLLEDGTRLDRQYVAVECHGGSGQAIRSADHKYIAFNDDPVEMLFDMREDPAETRNLVALGEHEGELQRHRSYLREWLTGLDTAPSVPDRCRW
jgi:arylsulfatase A-like enzyme